jgi:hypothetical protein
VFDKVIANIEWLKYRLEIAWQNCEHQYAEYLKKTIDKIKTEIDNKHVRE